MAGLVPAIHVFLLNGCKDVDARHEAGHDEARHEKNAIFSVWLMRRIGASGSDVAAWGLRTIPFAIRVEPRDASSEGWKEGWIAGGCGASTGSDFSATISEPAGGGSCT